MVNVCDDVGRVVIPNAIFAFEQRLRLVGVGSLPASSEAKFSPLNGTGLKLGMMDGYTYLLREYTNTTISTRGEFTTLVRESGDYVVPYKMFGQGGIEEKLLLSVPDADNITLITPYATAVGGSSRSGAVFFFLRKGARLAKIPMPNSYADGKFCIGTGVTFDSLPRPQECVDKVYDCLMEDKYNHDLADSQPYDNKWELQDNGTFLCTVPFDHCRPIINEKLIAAIL